MKKSIFILVCILFELCSVFPYEFENNSYKISASLVESKISSDKAEVSGNTLKTYYDEKYSEKSIDSYSGPDFYSGDELTDFFARLSYNELKENIRSDGVFSAGAKWPTAWTRDMSYAIDLSLSFLFPSVSKKSLESRVEDFLILQDTGSGGSYPVSTDRIVWLIAAYDFYLYEQNSDFAKWIYEVGKKTLNQDFNVNYDDETGLFRGESSFIDWREQSYPRWATSQYIADGFALGTNMVYYKALSVMKNLSCLFEPESESFYKDEKEKLSSAIYKHFWIEEKNYFASIILNDIKTYRYEGYETLGESLGVLNELVPPGKELNVLSAVKSQDWGLSVLSPQLSKIPPYHNDAVWPFVQAYRCLASKKAKDAFTFEKEFSSMIYAASMFQTFKENYVASSFSADTQTNSSRQLWSDAGFLSVIYRILCGIDFTDKGLCVSPFVPDSFKNGIKLRGFKVSSSVLSLEINGTGDVVSSFILNGKKVENDFVISYDFIKHNKNIEIKIDLKKSDSFINSYDEQKRPKPVFNASEISPMIPNTFITYDGKTPYVSWKPKNTYRIVTAKKEYKTSESEEKTSSGENMTLYEVFADSENKNVPVMPGKIIRVESEKNTKFYEAENADFSGGEIKNEDSFEIVNASVSPELSKVTANFNSFIDKWGEKEGDYISFSVNIKREGDYVLDFRYKNGHGPVNTGEKCAIRALYVDDELIKRLPFPQIGSWASWDFTSSVIIHFTKGKHSVVLKCDEYSKSQHEVYNFISLDLLRVSKIK